MEMVHMRDLTDRVPVAVFKREPEADPQGLTEERRDLHIPTELHFNSVNNL